MEGSQAYRVTLSPKQDICEEAEKKFVKWATKQADYLYIVAEHGTSGKRHVHALLLFPVKRAKSVIHNYIWQQHVKPYHPDSIQKFAVLCNTAYDFKWRDEYLQKEEDREVLHEKWDDTHVSKYLPTPEEQNALIEQMGDARKGRCYHDHKMWVDMAAHFKVDYIKDKTSVNWKDVIVADCLEWINREMLEGRMVVMVDERRRVQKAVWLWRVVTNNSKPTGLESVLVDKVINPYTDGRMA